MNSLGKQLEQLVSDFLKISVEDKKPPLIVLLGPTASGKTGASISLAHTFNAEIISADSRQVYRGMDIGTDKIKLEKNAEGLFHDSIRHHLIDVADPTERFTVADFKRHSEKAIEEMMQRKKIPFVVGGTGLYIRALTDNFLFPGQDLEIRKKIYDELEKIGAEKLHERLQKLDPESAATIHYNNIPYLTRALEIIEITGKPKSALQGKPKYRVLKIGLNWPRDILFKRIEERIDAQVHHNGLIEETGTLLEQGYSPEIPSMKSLGYQEMVQYIQGKLTLEAATELLKLNTRNFAKRQMTWWKREPDINWIAQGEVKH
ncbi:tRNA (adenosine(37)-N6)-dimethylallyltransferase MiaA [Candidatus Gracilibacteria bacterium]|nr:tRNA (adenosine(37)-N6)-dimethylallyltransferase MiaA [Candidatus Gracilibacteria bacterium]